MSARLRPVVACLALVLVAGASSADVVHLRGGRRIVGSVEETGDSVRIRFEGGALTIPRSQVESIERSDLPREAFAGRFAALAEDDVPGALALAAFAQGAGLADEEGRVLARAAAKAPDDPRLCEALRSWSVHRRRLPDDPEADARLVAAAGPGADTLLHLTAHFRVVHDVDPARARQVGEALEAAYAKVYEVGARLRVGAKPVERRVDVLLFADHARWMRAIGRPEEELRGLSGVYLHDVRRVVLFDTATLPAARDARAALDQAREKLAAYEAALDAARSGLARAEAEATENLRGAPLARRRVSETAQAAARASLRADEERLAAERARLAAFERDWEEHAERENLATTTHEACHALSFASGLCREGQPVWILEGVATLFEVTSRRTFDVEAPNEMRLDDLRKAWGRAGAADTSGAAASQPTAGAGPVESSLVAVVSDQGFADPTADHSLAYAEAWSLAWHLSRKRPEQFARLLSEGHAVAAKDPGAAASRLADFRACFGDDLAAVEREWKADVGRLLR